MKEILDRINEEYLKNARRYDTKLDYAVYMFLNIAYMAANEDMSIDVADFRKGMCEVVEVALAANAERHLLHGRFGKSAEEQEKIVSETLVERLKTQYCEIKKTVGYGDKRNSHFRAAAENVIGFCATDDRISVNVCYLGCVRDMFKTYRAICKSW